MSVALEEPRSSLLDLNEDAWGQIRSSLQPFAMKFVLTMLIPAWHGQEYDFAEDIVQETIKRAIERVQKAELGEMMPIYSLKNMLIVIASNYCKDVRRREKRMQRLDIDASLVKMPAAHNMVVDCSNVAIELIYREDLFKRIVPAIMKFPVRQREALLIDLSNRMSFGPQPTPLQQAFLDVGIALEQYQQPLPADLKLRSRYAALRTHAYKRLSYIARKWEIED